MADRWGIKGDNWQKVRPVPLGEVAARDWAASLSRGQRAEPIGLYRRSGDADWQLVQRYEVERGGDR